MNDYALNENEKKFIRLLKDRKKETETDDDLFCVMLATINDGEQKDEFFYLDKGLEFAENHPDASSDDIFNFILSLRYDEKEINAV